MKQTFPGYYRPTKDEFAVLWNSARFALDANVLLNLYGYSSATRKKLLELFEGVGERLWIPHQFAMEFQRNRAKAILDQVESYKSIGAQFKKVLDQHLKPRHRHDDDGDFTRSDEPWRAKAWLRPMVRPDRVIFRIFPPRNTVMSKAHYAVYHARFVEMLLRHFDDRFTEVVATALPKHGDRVNTEST